MSVLIFIYGGLGSRFVFRNALFIHTSGVQSKSDQWAVELCLVVVMQKPSLLPMKWTAPVLWL